MKKGSLRSCVTPKDFPRMSVNSYEWVTKNWNGFSDFMGRRLWTDGTNIYYSYGYDDTDYVLNGDTWERKTWSGSPKIDPQHMWTDGTNVYSSWGSSQYVLNGDVWESKTWSGISPEGSYVWSDGTNVYYSNGFDQYVFNGDIWEPKTWGGSYPYGGFIGSNVWSDGINIFIASGSTHYVITGDVLELKVWNGLTNFYGENVWSDGIDTYCCVNETLDNGSYKHHHYVLNGDTWDEIDFTGLSDTHRFYGEDVWSDGTNIYYSYHTNHYMLNVPVRNLRKGGLSCTTIKFPTNYPHASTWKDTTWNFEKFTSTIVWSDGKNIYMDDGRTIHYVLKDGAWEANNWNVNIYGHNVWTDGTNVYHSGSPDYYILNGDTWELKEWNQSHVSSYIWSDGTNTYYSYGDTQYVLKDGVWETKTWNGLTKPDLMWGSIWSDGTNIYYSNLFEGQYVLNGDTWEPKEWKGLRNDLVLVGDSIWSDGENVYGRQVETIYDSDGVFVRRDYYHYVLNGDTWEPKEWKGPLDFGGSYMWSDGVNIYYSAYLTTGEGSHTAYQYVLERTDNPEPSKPSINPKYLINGLLVGSAISGMRKK